MKKKITCHEMGGPCDMVFTGETSGEIAKAAAAHMTEAAKSDPAHKEVYDEMAAIAASNKKHEQWKKRFQQLWDDAPSA
ncbi:MAG TPA: hypothetical protein PKV72_04255 [Candidatus Peribacteria bacterium]|nr:hypothetical protein [Candidatus Peribacteria bacterium]